MKGKLISAETSCFHAISSNDTLWTLVIETLFLKRKVKKEIYIDDTVNVKSYIGKYVEV